MSSFVISSASFVEGRPATRTIGLVFGEVVQGANFFKDFKTGLRDTFGGRSSTSEKLFVELRNEAISEMTKRAQAAGANAVVGFRYDMDAIGAQGSMYCGHAYGTAVVLS